MATIEREIDGFRWLVDEGGNVHRNERTVIYSDVVTNGYSWTIDVIETAIALRREWEALKAKELEDAPPTIELSDGDKLYRNNARWYLRTGETTSLVPLCGDDWYRHLKMLVAAADELAARKAKS